MAQPSDEPQQNLSQIHWFYPEWLAQRPLVDADAALDYFAQSPFFDKRSNNSQLRTQRIIENPSYGHAIEKLELPAFRSGFEYVPAHSAEAPRLFVIHRREVQADGSRDNVSGMWFVLDSRIYQCPTLYDVLASRLKNAVHLVGSTFDAFASSHPPSNPRTQDTWRSLPPSAVASSSSRRRTAPDQPAATAAPGEEALMDVDEPPTDPSTSAAKPKEEDDVAQPDWHLFNALAVTRQSLSDLEQMAAKPRPPRDAKAELRRLEEEMGVRKGGSARSISMGPARSTAGVLGGGGGGGVEGMSPALTGRGRIGTPSVAGGGGRAVSVASPLPGFSLA